MLLFKLSIQPTTFGWCWVSICHVPDAELAQPCTALMGCGVRRGNFIYQRKSSEDFEQVSGMVWFIFLVKNIMGELLRWSSSEGSTCQCRGHGHNPSSGKAPHATGQRSPGAATMPWSLCFATRGAAATRSWCTTSKTSPCSPQLEKAQKKTLRSQQINKE